MYLKSTSPSHDSKLKTKDSFATHQETIKDSEKSAEFRPPNLALSGRDRLTGLKKTGASSPGESTAM